MATFRCSNSRANYAFCNFNRRIGVKRNWKMWLLLYQGHPTTKSFQITQKCLWMDFTIFVAIYFFNFELPKTLSICLRCLRRTLAVSKVLGDFFLLIRSFSYPEGLVETVRTRTSHTFESQNFGGRFLFIPKFSGDLTFIASNRQNLGWKCELHFA